MPRYQVTIDECEFDVELSHALDAFTVSVNGREYLVKRNRLGEHRSLLLIDNQSHEVDIHTNGRSGEALVFMGGIEVIASVEDYNLAQLRKTAGLGVEKAAETYLRAPMPGLVIDIMVKPSDRISKGTPLLVIEAMKMENVLRAKSAVTISKVNVETGKSVEKGDSLVEFE
jgi:acetyl/propionyl-CoA carboxylase alpha subunit